MKDFFSKWEQICSFLWIWSHLLKKPYGTLYFLYSGTTIFSPQNKIYWSNLHLYLNVLYTVTIILMYIRINENQQNFQHKFKCYLNGFISFSTHFSLVLHSTKKPVIWLHCKSNDWILYEMQHWTEMGWSVLTTFPTVWTNKICIEISLEI